MQPPALLQKNWWANLSQRLLLRIIQLTQQPLGSCLWDFSIFIVTSTGTKYYLFVLPAQEEYLLIKSGLVLTSESKILLIKKMSHALCMSSQDSVTLSRRSTQPKRGLHMVNVVYTKYFSFNMHPEVKIHLSLDSHHTLIWVSLRSKTETFFLRGKWVSELFS